MNIKPFRVRAAWDAQTLERDKSWVLELSSAHREEILAALRVFKSWAHDRGLTAQWLHGYMAPPRESFPLPTLAPLLADVQQNLEQGYGLALVRGFPTTGLSLRELHLLHAGFSSHVGTPRPQTVFGELVQDLRDMGQAALIERRGSKHNRGLPFHNDPCDVVSFLCIQPSASGGVGQYMSSVALHNALLAAAPEHVATLYEDLVHAYQEYLFVRTGTNDAWLPKERYYRMPTFSAAQGKFACKYSRFYIDQAQENPNVPRLTAAQQAALGALEAEMQDPKWQLQVPYRAGDAVFINNYVCFHARTPFSDSAEQRRHMLRIWLAMPNSRELSPKWAQHVFYQRVDGGSLRGGVPGPMPDYGIFQTT
jgi:hypothetical protein